MSQPPTSFISPPQFPPPRPVPTREFGRVGARAYRRTKKYWQLFGSLDPVVG
ncbi:hypothetical protein ACRALDRAFT_1065935, partial [Sodiomyces alcalophilus JCM 7366]|uniref:uncharacterized protein n=1 Tax=Sodiomyces alcalophilus JCM 7366 TaxID=591952 RepID=UPI0039B388CC